MEYMTKENIESIESWIFGIVAFVLLMGGIRLAAEHSGAIIVALFGIVWLVFSIIWAILTSVIFWLILIFLVMSFIVLILLNR
jgi:hypothetical protein